MLDCKKEAGNTTESAKANSNAKASNPPAVTAINNEYSNGTKMSNAIEFVTEQSTWLAMPFSVNALTSNATAPSNAGQKNRKDAPASANVVTVANRRFHATPAVRYSVAEVCDFPIFLKQNSNSPASTKMKVRAKGTPAPLTRR